LETWLYKTHMKNLYKMYVGKDFLVNFLTKTKFPQGSKLVFEFCNRCTLLGDLISVWAYAFRWWKEHLLDRSSVLIFSLKACLDVVLEISYICALGWVCWAPIYIVVSVAGIRILVC